MKAGEWYYYTDRYGYDWVLKFAGIKDGKFIVYKCYKIYDGYNDVTVSLFTHLPLVNPIRHATREEIIKYFPHEFEVNAHGGNDIPQVTDPQL